MLDGQTAATGNGTGLFKLLKSCHRRVDDVDRVRRTERLAQHIVDAGTLQDGANGATGEIIRELTIDLTRDYQPASKKK